MKRHSVSIILLTFLLLFTSACGMGDPSSQSDSTTGQLKPITVVLDWTPNTNHTGLYVARDQGFFKDAGLDVKIIQPGEAGSEKMIATGQAEFAVSNQESVTQARAQGVPIVSIGAIIQHNTSGFASPVAKNIQRPKDFEGKKYGGFGSPIEKQMISSLMTIDQADPNKVKIINSGNIDFFTAVKKDVDFMWIYYAWTGIEAELRGEKLNTVYLTDYSKDLDYYTPVLIAGEKTIKQDPETVRSFMKAVSQGYEFSIQNPEQAADILIKAEPDLDPDLVKKSQAWLSKRYQDDAPRWGEQKVEVWTNYANWLKKYQLLEGEFDPATAFTNDFLPKGE
ncbi:ABC-type nitrate/sulfonate/bicarbonate transport system substrate-binding protein [Hazenella coriacea]|uniref:ABC-type nitrate/sulfonate/bicarbonate transport system substrate-binding protein n=2 Tax=Hazenella coriacea TaxID=1179467 RepID=A0A4V2UVI1_9BACL|nr:ABC-type nitrate/sulfonate/bicarbonate transport system substrate-binding protein [Hazenella coriacea]